MMVQGIETIYVEVIFKGRIRYLWVTIYTFKQASELLRPGKILKIMLIDKQHPYK